MLDALAPMLSTIVYSSLLVLPVVVIRVLDQRLPHGWRGGLTIGVILGVGVVSLLAYTPLYEASDPRANCAAGHGVIYRNGAWHFVASVASTLAVLLLPVGSVLLAIRGAGGASYRTRFILGALAVAISFVAIAVIILGNSLATGLQCI
jgi:hypothetical protein